MKSFLQFVHIIMNVCCETFHMLQVEENRKYRMHINGDLMFKSDYMTSRSVFGSVELKKGRYVLIPTTKDAGVTGKFMLRLYTSSPASSK